MKAIRLLGAALTFVLFAPTAKAGEITGKVTLAGNPAKKEQAVPAATVKTSCPNCRKDYNNIKIVFYKTDAKGGLADVFVYLKGVEGDFPPPAEPIILDQVGCEYIPYIAVGQAGQKIVIKNSDPVLHNVHPIPRVKGNKEFNKAQLPRGKDLEEKFDKEELFLHFMCNVHPWMHSYVCLVDHPFFSLSKEDGTFSIKNVPPGEYEIVAVHRKAHGPKYDGVVKKVTVGEGKAEVDFEVAGK